MANSRQPTRRTRHMDAKHFAIQEWVESDILTLKRVATHDNEADPLTKNVGRSLFYRHIDFIMGKIKPEYVNTNPQYKKSSKQNDA